MMYESVITLLLTTATIGAGLMAGVYFAFSCFIMRAFDQLGAVQATGTMISINEVILRSGFMIVFFGSTLLYVVLGVFAIFDTGLPNRWFLLLICVIYIAGMFLCTAVLNVPLNNRLANAVRRDSTNFEVWPHYLKHWTRWNHLRTSCSLLSLVLSVHYLVSHN